MSIQEEKSLLSDGVGNVPEATDEININYQEEIVLLFYNSLLDHIVDKWITVEKEEPVVEDSVNGELVNVKDFKELSKEDLTNSSIKIVEGSKVSLSKIKLPSTSQLVKASKGSGIKVNGTSEKNNFSGRSDSRSNVSNPQGGESLKKSNSGSGMAKLNSNNWIVQTKNEDVIIIFKNGNCYEGSIENKRLHGRGVFSWSDGVVYEGEFKNGNMAGECKMVYTDNSYYLGSVCNGLLHGKGCMYVSNTEMIYSGNWKAGKKHGQGWILYHPNNWYDGEWCENKRQGIGLRQYDKSSRYQGNWYEDVINGQGTMVWSNRDYYKGEWSNRIRSGYGEYIWNTFLNKTFTFPIKNMYQGYWSRGMRNGTGVLHFGFSGGARMAGKWVRNMKHGEGIIVCGNGNIIQKNPLFLYDKPVYLNTWQFMPTGYAAENETDMVEESNSKFRINVPDFPKTLSMQINPLCIPVHADPQQIDISFHLQNVGTKYRTESSTNCVDELCIAYEHDLIAEQSLKDILNFEETKMRFAITSNFVILQDIYNRYATITTTDNLSFKPVLIRLFMWQLYLDIDISTKGFSIIDIDLLLNENPTCAFESEHDPFEKIYLWQFLLCLISIAWALYSDHAEDYKDNGILAEAFLQLLYKDIMPNAGKIKGTGLCEYKNLLPINSVYLLYRSLGEPHTVRKFFACCLKKGWPVCTEKIFDGVDILAVRGGKNIISVGESIIFFPHSNKVGQKPKETTPHVYKPGMPLKNLNIFSQLKAKQVVKNIGKICPVVVKEGVIVDMNYKLSFLEFLNIILLCAYTVIDEAKNRESKMREREERAKLVTSKMGVSNFTRSTKQSKKPASREKKAKK